MPIRTDPAPRPAAAETDPASALVAQRPGRFPGPSLPGIPAGPAGHPTPRPAPRRPDPTSARLALAAGGIATLSALLAAIASTAVPAATAAAAPTAGGAATAGPVRTIVKYVYVQPGQAAPTAGLATVITPPAPRAVPAPVVTRQSGKP
jgi:hypothetical protein